MEHKLRLRAEGETRGVQAALAAEELLKRVEEARAASLGARKIIV